MHRARIIAGLTTLTAAAVLLFGASANADVVAQELFDYDAGTTLNGKNGGSGWSGGWGRDGSSDLYGDVTSPGLTDPSLPDTDTNKASIDASGSSHARPERSFASGIGADGLWISFIGDMNTEYRRASGLSLKDGSGNNFAWIGRPNNGDQGDTDPGNWAIGDGLSSSSAMNEATDDNGDELKTSEQALVVTNLNVDGGTWTLDMFLNPDGSGTASASHTATFTHNNASGSANLGKITFFVGDGSLTNIGPAEFDFDELRIGESFGDVVIPEPGSLALLAPAGLLMLRRRR